MTTTAKTNKQDTARHSAIKPSPENDDLYGAIDPDDIDLINLANEYAENGIRKP